MNHNFIRSITLIFIFFLLSEVLFAQKDTNITSDNLQTTKDNYFSLQEKSKHKFELLTKDNEIREQKIYKYTFLALAGFILIIAGFIIFVFYTKSKKITSFFDVQNREIKLRDIQIQQLSTIINTVQSSIMLIAGDGSIKWLNKSFEKYYDISLEDLKKQDKDNFIKNIANEKELEYIEKCVTEKKSVSYMTDAGTGKTYKINRNMLALTDSEGNVSGIVITDNKIAN